MLRYVLKLIFMIQSGLTILSIGNDQTEIEIRTGALTRRMGGYKTIAAYGSAQAV
jgi:hypothetical protein